MSEEFKKEEINGEAAEETKAAEHTEEVKAETTAEQSAAETEKPQETAEAPKTPTPENRTRRRQRQSRHLLQRQNIISTSHRHRVLRSRKNHSFLPLRSRRITKRKRKNQCQPQKNGA